jgi:hypothetical protein
MIDHRSSRGGRAITVLICALLAAMLQSAAAHHAFNPQLDTEGEQAFAVLEGSVRVFRVVNPHGVLIVNVPDADGEVTPWLIELNPATQLSREGWTDDIAPVGARVSVAVAMSSSQNRGRLRALLVHAEDTPEPAQLFVAYGIRGDTPVMRRLRERLPSCGIINEDVGRTACFSIDSAALSALAEEFPGPMGFVMAASE